jgi:hypothetical protein
VALNTLPRNKHKRLFKNIKKHSLKSLTVYSSDVMIGLKRIENYFTLNCEINESFRIPNKKGVLSWKN